MRQIRSLASFKPPCRQQLYRNLAQVCPLTWKQLLRLHEWAQAIHSLGLRICSCLWLTGLVLLLFAGPAHGGSAAPGMGMPGMGMPGMAGMDTNQMLQMMQNPMVQSMMTSMLSNPDMLRQLEESNPMLRSMLDGNPAMREMMRNPEMMRQMMNPAVIQQASQLMASMGGMPGGMPGAATGATTATGVNPFAAFAPSSSAPVTSTAPTSAAPGPDFASMMASMMGSGATTGTASSASSSGTAPAPAVPAPPAAPTVPAAELYRDQLTQMREMGFNDEALCIRALQSAGGNVQIAIERLFSGGM